MAYKLFENKRGSEKPIEIFIALFVILAVAMVLLKMFGGQITSKQKELKDVADQNRVEQLRKDIKIFCNSRCADIDGKMDKVNYCKTKYLGNADVNDNDIPNDYNDDLSIVSLCEDSVYCAAVTDCRELTMKNCAQILCSYFKNEWQLDDTAATERLSSLIQPGTCIMTDEQKSNHWYYMLEDDFNCGTA
jgi:hypothetical protein